jgi:hypothetical protein
VEIGQLMAVAVAWAAWRLVRGWQLADRSRVPLLYGIGSLAAYWSWLRIVAIFS